MAERREKLGDEGLLEASGLSDVGGGNPLGACLTPQFGEVANGGDCGFGLLPVQIVGVAGFRVMDSENFRY